MNSTLNRFTTDSLFNATSALLSKLNIEFDRETAEPISVADLYDGAMPKYLTDALECIDHTYFIGIVNDGSLRGEKSADSLASVASTVEHGGKYDGMFIFACDAKPDASLTRTAASALTRAFNRIASANPVILIIRQGYLLSLATCERMEYSQIWRQGGGEKLGKVSILRNINCAEPHRGHVDILESLDGKTFQTFEELYKHWITTFSSELLTKKFYSELSDWYAWAVMVAKFPNDIRTNEDDAKFNHESCIRLITRLIFVWFLKQKQLIPEEFFDEKFIRENFIDNFDPHDKQSLYYNAGESKYYRLILQNLFFAMLNCPIVAEGKTTPNNRRFRGDNQFGFKRDGYNVNNLMRYKSEFADGGADKFVALANRSVPFLNGGLFDCLDDKPKGLYYDGFSERKESLQQLFFPDYLFFGEEVGKGIDLSQWYDDKKKKNVSARGIIDILKRYSFTIEENTPYDQEVSLDPELLGKVFENLLAAYNPETKQSARKQTGSFYTPREIVQYMVDESLVAHLKRMCGDEMEPQYRQLLNYAADDVTLSDDQRKSIMNALYNCRVLDPACGSGAFPMGILQQMVHVLKRIDPSNKMWESMMVEIAVEEAKKELQKVTSGNDAERSKIEENRKARLEDIENAFNQSINDPDYARKLYLIEHCIYGVDIQPIATQISKLRFFISLVVDQKPTKDAKANFGIRPLPNLEAKFVTANTLIPLDRTKNLFTDTEEIRRYEELLQDINHRIFLAKKNSVKRELRELMQSTRVAMAQTMENMGAIGSKGYNQLMEWNMFDQNASASFFDPEWMFGVKDGFDIVIANPPYVSSKDLSTNDKDLYKRLYRAADKQFDLYSLFVERGLSLLCKSGVTSYIIPDSIIGRSNFAVIRSILIIENSISKWIHLNNVFESAVVSSLIYVCTKCNKLSYSFDYIKADSVQLWKNHVYKTQTIKSDIVKSDQEKRVIFAEEEKLSLQQKLQTASLFKTQCAMWRGEEIGKKSDLIRTTKTAYSYPLITGSEAKRYGISVSNKWIKTVDVVKSLDNYMQPKVIIRQVGECINATLDLTSGITTQSVYALYPNNINHRLHLKAFVGILNSKLFDFFYRLVSGDKQMFKRIILENIKALPYPDMDSPLIPKIDALVDCRFKQSDDFSIEPQIDHIVYHLYNLTYDEVLIIDPETPITREEYDNFILD